MHEYIDAVEFFIEIVNALKQNHINPQSPLDEIVLRTSHNSFAYVDNRADALKKYNADLWDGIRKQCKNQTDFIKWLQSHGVNKRILYSKSEQFPDFIFKVRKQANALVCGSLLELKDSKGGNIASFNSTLPSKLKSLDEVDIINGNRLVSRVVSILDGELSSDENYHTYQRRNFYLIRTYKENKTKIKISIVEGSFFETLPKEHLIYQMFLNIVRNHMEKKDIQISPQLLKEFEKSLSCITDQTIIAASQTIEKASLRPRLRIMAEVHAEGNPHSSFYPEISDRTFNFIIQDSSYEEKIAKLISKTIPDIKTFSVKHKRNGMHRVFQSAF